MCIHRLTTSLVSEDNTWRWQALPFSDITIPETTEQRRARAETSFRHRFDAAQSRVRQLEQELFNHNAENERLQAQVSTVGAVLLENARLQRELDEYKHRCSTLERQRDQSVDDQRQALHQAREAFGARLSLAEDSAATARRDAVYSARQYRRLCDQLRDAQARLDPSAVPFDPAADDLSVSVRRFFARFAARVSDPVVAELRSQAATAEALVDELTSANIAYARELRRNVNEPSSRRRIAREPSPRRSPGHG